METNHFIKSLSTGLKPVRRLPSPYVRFSYWLLASILATAVLLFFRGVRSDLVQALSDPEFLIQSLLLVLMTVMAAISAFIMSVPGEKQSKHRWYLAGILGSLLAMILIFSAWKSYNSGNMRAWFPGSGLSCLVSISILSAFPGILLFAMLRRAAPLRLSVSGSSAFLAVTALASLASNINCDSNIPAHILVWHFIPVLVMALIGARLGKWFLRW